MQFISIDKIVLSCDHCAFLYLKISGFKASEYKINYTVRKYPTLSSVGFCSMKNSSRLEKDLGKGA